MRKLTALPPADYEDAFALELGASAKRSAADWARAVLEEAPERLRQEVRDAWSALGFELEPPGCADAILGWRLRREEPEVAVLATSSPLGIRGELVFANRPEGLLYATFVSLAGEDARRAWARIEPAHPLVVRELLDFAADRIAVHTRRH